MEDNYKPVTALMPKTVYCIHLPPEKNLNFLVQYRCKLVDCPILNNYILSIIKFTEIQDGAHFS